MNQSFEVIEKNGHRFVVKPAENRKTDEENKLIEFSQRFFFHTFLENPINNTIVANIYPNANFLGKGLALCGQLRKGESLQMWINAQSFRHEEAELRSKKAVIAHKAALAASRAAKKQARLTKKENKNRIAS